MQTEKDYINNIFSNCSSDFIEKVYSQIIFKPLDRIVIHLRDLIEVRQSKKSAKIALDFFHNFDVLNVWHHEIQKAYLTVVKGYNNEEEYLEIQRLIKEVENYCYNYIKEYLDDIDKVTEKPENENIMQICNRVIY